MTDGAVPGRFAHSPETFFGFHQRSPSGGWGLRGPGVIAGTCPQADLRIRLSAPGGRLPAESKGGGGNPCGADFTGVELPAQGPRPHEVLIGILAVDEAEGMTYLVGGGPAGR